jgi:SRSO17 transposase
MVAEQWPTEETGTAVLAAWARAMERVQERIAHRFGRAEVRARVRRYLRALIGQVERKNGWQLAEAMGEEGPQGVQSLLQGAVWDAEAVRDDLRAYVVEHLGDATGGVLIIDETGFPKTGRHSCGVAPQYCGTLGRSANCQVGVFLGYASAVGMAFLDRALYLPRSWTTDRARCARAGVPPEQRFATKGELAKGMLARACAAGVPAAWVVADSLYGRAAPFRAWLEGQERPYVVGILPVQAVEHAGHRQRAKTLAAGQPPEAWARRSAGAGCQGERVHDWLCVPLSGAAPAGWARWLLVRRSLSDPRECAYFLACGPAGTTQEELVRVAGLRWAVEEGFAQAKGAVGLDQYEVRRWTAWHRQITLCLLAHAALVVACALARHADRAAPRAAARPALLPLSVPEVRRLILVGDEDPTKQAFLLRWSHWRRRHQAVAHRCHVARRLRERLVAPVSAPHPLPRADLTDAEWARLAPLLPPQRPPVGRPRHDHRTVLGGILWVLRTASPWRDMPPQFGKANTAFVRYRLWRRQGLWQRLIDALGPEAAPPTPAARAPAAQV